MEARRVVADCEPVLEVLREESDMTAWDIFRRARPVGPLSENLSR